MKWSMFIIALLLLWSCGNKQEQNAQGKWIKGTGQERLETIENQFRGSTWQWWKQLTVTSNCIGRERMRTGTMPLINWKKFALP